MSRIEQLIKAVGAKPHQVYPLHDGLMVATYEGGWVRVMETPGESLLVGVACADVESAAEALRGLLGVSGA